VILENQLNLTPKHTGILLNLGVAQARLQKYEAAIKNYQQVLDIEPENLVALDGVTSALSGLQRYDEAIKFGRRVLDLKDQRSKLLQSISLQVPDSSPHEYARLPGKHNVISFSLWGNHPAYLRGALRNLLLAADMYPGWTLRFNLDRSVPEDFINLIDELNGEIVMQSSGATIRQKLGWRFKVANDPNVGYFLIRDADSVFSIREVLAVQAWLNSDKWFHVMRDWWTHTDLILAGMWGGVAGILPDLSDALIKYQSGKVETPNIDQWFLRDQVWPCIRNICLAHDRYFTSKGSTSFPEPEPVEGFHVGQNEYAAHLASQERTLKPWIDAYPCLGMRIDEQSGPY
jgi:tetratricopeptide (TPR) repeat protein